MLLARLRLQARYNVLTPALLGLYGGLLIGAAQAQSIDEVNNGTVQDYVIGAGRSFTNNGTVNGNTQAAVTDSGDVNWFTNSSSGNIFGGSQRGVYFDDTFLGTFLNQGTISSASDYAVGFDTNVGTFINRGTISGANDGAQFDNSVTTFTNSGSITSSSSRGVYFNLGVGTFTNAQGGAIRANSGTGVDFNSTVDKFQNAGIIEGDGGSGNAAIFRGAITSFSNTGTMDSDYGVSFQSSVGSFSNSGTIKASEERGVTLSGAVGSFSNTGTISGNSTGVQVNNSAGVGVVISNAGRISGGTNSVYFDAADGTLKLLTGASLSGKVRYSGSSGDKLDVSSYRGSIVVDVDGLQNGNVVAGNNLYLQTTDKVVVVGVAGVSTSPQLLSGIATGVNGMVTGQLDFEATGAPPGDDPLGYAPAPNATAAEQATATALKPAASGPVVWANAAAGGTSKSGDNSVYGAVVFGSHTALSSDATGGVLGGYARSSSRTDNSQTVTSDIGVFGLYGRGDLGLVTVDVALLGGVSGNNSSRDVSTGGNTQVARASFGGWFVNPTIGLSVPVLSTADGELAVAGSASYLYGGFGGYTETGSSTNLTVGPQTIGVLNLGLGLQGNMVLSANEHGAILGKAKVELFAESNLGTSSVPVSVLGTSIGNAVAPNAVAYGLRGNVGVEMPIGERLTVTAGANGSIRTDGYVSGGANLKLSGTL
jgi:hypothetical protein